MARKKRSSKIKGKGKGRPAVLSLARPKKRGAKTRVGRGRTGSVRKGSTKSQVRGRRY